MALVTFSGFPSSGKSTRVAELKAALDTRIAETSSPLSVVVLSDDALGTPRTAYADARAEKTARGALLAAVQRALAPNAIVLLDGLNYIKGWRYQLYCAARELKLRVCTVRVRGSAGRGGADEGGRSTSSPRRSAAGSGTRPAPRRTATPPRRARSPSPDPRTQAHIADAAWTR
jgi:hypothetical protein